MFITKESNFKKITRLSKQKDKMHSKMCKHSKSLFSSKIKDPNRQHKKLPLPEELLLIGNWKKQIIITKTNDQDCPIILLGISFKIYI